jgi:hypothetical protein
MNSFAVLNALSSSSIGTVFTVNIVDEVRHPVESRPNRKTDGTPNGRPPRAPDVFGSAAWTVALALDDDGPVCRFCLAGATQGIVPEPR